MATKRSKKPRHIPQRTCVGCRQVLAKRELIRLVRTEDSVQIDPSGKLPGRGAYLHDRKSCWETGLKGRLEKALNVSMTAQNKSELRQFMETLDDNADEIAQALEETSDTELS